MKWLGSFLVLLFGSALLEAATLATFRTSVGTMELELYDEDKPITVSNFVKYVTSGRFENLIVQRWETNFVIQAGGYYVENPDGEDATFRTVKTFGTITNEYSVGQEYSNTRGTIAMARQPGAVDSATSQWFLNVKDNVFLDDVDEGFTVFGKVLSGYEVLDLFIPPPPVHGIYRTAVQGVNEYDEFISMNTLPITSTNGSFSDLIYIDISLRRDLGLEVQRLRGQTVLSWDSVAGVENIVEYSTTFPPVWQQATSVVGTGEEMTYTEQGSDPARFYRLGLIY